MSAKGYAIHDSEKWSDFALIDFKLKTAEPYDVDIAITNCGVCASDIHTITNGWGNFPDHPVVPGHEIVGKVTKVGSSVTEFKVGDIVGVGAQVSACFDCKACSNDNEQYCQHGVDTYNSKFPNGDIAQGGYSTAIRTHERFVFPIPDGLEPRLAASSLCAGLTMYSPLVRNAKKGDKVGIVGIGGLGHYGIMFAKALGYETYAFTHSERKIEDIKKLGADHIINTNDPKFGEKHAMELDLIVSTVDVAHGLPLSDLLPVLNIHGRFVSVGLPDHPLDGIQPQAFAGNGSFFGSSHIGSKKEAVAMLQLMADKKISPWIEEMPMSQAKEAVERLKKNDIRYRFVLSNDIEQ